MILLIIIKGMKYVVCHPVEKSLLLTSSSKMPPSFCSLFKVPFRRQRAFSAVTGVERALRLHPFCITFRHLHPFCVTFRTAHEISRVSRT